MRTTITIDDDLLTTAEAYTSVTERSALIRMALTALVQREAAPRLARLGGSVPEVQDIPRRRENPVAAELSLAAQLLQ